MALIFPTFYAITGGLILQWLLGYNFSMAVWVGYIALFGIAVETGVVLIATITKATRKISLGYTGMCSHQQFQSAAIPEV
jgi:Cu(I)/Ag(I) efflux system membrane protein CusA/SilA